MDERRHARVVTRPANLAQVVLGLLAVRLGLTVLSGHDVHHDQWIWLIPVLLVAGGLLVVAALVRRRRA